MAEMVFISASYPSIHNTVQHIQCVCKQCIRYIFSVYTCTLFSGRKYWIVVQPPSTSRSGVCDRFSMQLQSVPGLKCGRSGVL